MFRIDHPTAATSRPAPAAAGTPGYFQRGNPSTSTPPTTVTADWANMLQEELMSVLIAAAVTPDKTNIGQLLVALQTLFIARDGGSTNDGRSTAAPVAGHGIAYAPLVVREAGRAGATAGGGDTTIAAPRYAWTWAGRASTQLYMRQDGGLVAVDDTGLSYRQAYFGQLYCNDNAVWHSANDGAGSGLDADLLDGKDWTGGQDVNFGQGIFHTPNAGSSGAVRILGNGTSGFAYVQFLDSTGTAQWGYIRCNASGDLAVPGKFIAGDQMSVGGSAVWNAGNDGSGSGLDADLLDGHDSTYFLQAANYNAGDVLAKLLTVDGSGSGLDADLLDGHDSSYFTPASSSTTGSNSDGWWEKRPNGVIEQWGRIVETHGEGGRAVTFPISFTDASSVCISIDIRNPTADSGNDMWMQYEDPTTSGFEAVYQATSSGNTGAGFNWRAIGF